MFTGPSLIIVSPLPSEAHGGQTWRPAMGRAMAERLTMVSQSAFSPAEDKHFGLAHMHTGIDAVKHDVMTSGRLLKHSRL